MRTTKRVPFWALHLLLVLLLASSDLQPHHLQQCLAANPSLRRNSIHNDTDALRSSPTSTCSCENVPSFPLRIAYLIVVHNERTLLDAVHLVRAIRHPNHFILVHVDVKAQELLPNSSLLEEIQSCKCAGKSFRIDSVFNASWSHWSMNEPTLWGMQQLLETGDWDVFINLSGDALPVYRPAALAGLLSELRYNFVTSSSCETGLRPTNVYDFPSHWHKRVHYTHYDTEPDPVVNYAEGGQSKRATMVTHFGSQWMILQRPLCEWLVWGLQRNDSLPSLYRNYLQQSGKLMTDETYFATLVVQKFPETLPRVDADGFLVFSTSNASSTITDVRYERMDEHVPSSSGYLPRDQRYQVPPHSARVEPVRAWGPYFLGVYDLGDIRTSGALFVRKVSELVDDNMVRLLPVERRRDIPAIFWPQAEVSLSEKPNWEKKLAEMRRRAASKETPNYPSADDDEEL